MLFITRKTQPATIRKNILLCGTQYGSSYLSAIHQSYGLKLSAILAKGSRRSQILAEQAGVPLIASVDQLEQGPDVAVVALGNELGFSIAGQLLRKGIPVLLEHPVLPTHIDELLVLMRDYNTPLHINSHFSELSAAQELIKVCRKLLKLSRPLMIQVTCNSRTLFSSIDILQRIFGTFELGQPQRIKLDCEGYYQFLSVNIDDIPCGIIYQNWRYEQDDSTDAPLGHHIAITFPEGVACLSGTFGPFYWYPLVAAAKTNSVPLYTNVYAGDLGEKNPDRTLLLNWRVQANLRAINQLINSASQPEQIPSFQTPEYLSRLCANWASIFSGCVPIAVTPRVTLLESPFLTSHQILESDECGHTCK